jgi:hypothetical protein
MTQIPLDDSAIAGSMEGTFSLSQLNILIIIFRWDFALYYVLWIAMVHEACRRARLGSLLVSSPGPESPTRTAVTTSRCLSRLPIKRLGPPTEKASLYEPEAFVVSSSYWPKSVTTRKELKTAGVSESRSDAPRLYS